MQYTPSREAPDSIRVRTPMIEFTIYALVMIEPSLVSELEMLQKLIFVAGRCRRWV
ncbi:MAG: hypothetical protein BWY50_00698 [Spirochaetes bacterium ADurb.Bin315]|nr:MAG: hypothetical protein BWY50_00698 [Spirochaetes bacterium ADurb.Bin315]